MCLNFGFLFFFSFNSFRIRRIWLKKVKCTLVQALMLCTGRTAHRESRGIALSFLDHGTKRGWGVSVTPRPLFTPWKDPVSIVQESGWTPEPVWTGAENLAPPGIRSPDGPARSQSLYRLRYPARVEYEYTSSNFAQILICDLCVINLWFPLFTVQKWIICGEECSLLFTRTLSSALSLPLQ